MTTVTQNPERTRRPVPPLAEPVAPVAPEPVERTLPSGLRVIAVRRPGVPLVEARLRVPFAGVAGDVPRATLLAETLLSGTSKRSNIDIAVALQEVGGGLHASVDPDRLVLSGDALATGLSRLLEIMAEVLTDAAYPENEVATERDRLADRIRISLAQPATAVRKALLRRRFGDHPYAVEVPGPEEVGAVGADALRDLHRERVLPSGSVLIVVGDVDGDAVLDVAATAMSTWDRVGSVAGVPPVPPLPTGPLVLVDRPGAVQSSLRLALPAVGRDHPDYPALQVANLIFAGYFSSRVVTNIREDKGYTYSPHSVIEHSVGGSMIVFDADVATDVTAPSLLEIGYELGRVATLPPAADEVDDARQYAIGTLALSVATQSGLASWLSILAGSGLGIEWLAAHRERLAALSVSDVHRAAVEYLAPTKALTVVLGDASVVAAPLEVLGAVEREH